MKHQNFKRIGIVIWLFAFQLLYFPINRSVDGGISTLLSIDSYIKLTPVWAVPYLLSLYWWEFSMVWAAYKVDFDKLFRFALCLSLTIGVSYIVYLLFPTYVTRPSVQGDDVFTKLILFIYGNDRAYNVLPSNHTYTSIIIAIYWSVWYPKWKSIWILAALIVVLSTLFTKQHAVLDLVASGILVIICFKLTDLLIQVFSKENSELSIGRH